MVEVQQKHKHPRRPLRPWVKILAVSSAILLLILFVAAEYGLHHVEPILRTSVIDTLAARFHSPVELDRLDISLDTGIQVKGTGLRILYLAGPTQPGISQLRGGAAVPMVSVQQFVFHITLHDLRKLNARIEHVYVQGLELHIPPHSHNGLFTANDPKHPAKKPYVNLLVSKIECRDAKLFIETSRPGKDPLEFDIPNLELTDVGADKPMPYIADVVNPKPVGNVHAFGHFGPWQGADPRATSIDGIYTFSHADLSTIKGLGGILSSTGQFAGELGHITVSGETSVPDFSLDVSDHPMPLWTKFDAFVDGTSGDTTLTQVQARLGHSDFTTQGAILRIHNEQTGYHGHDISLNVQMPNGRMEDLLQISMKTEPPVMRGMVAMQATIHVPPGPVRVAQKVELAGKLSIQNVQFTNTKLQDRIDSLSMRAQGRPQDVKAFGSDRKAEVASSTAITFSLAHEMTTVPSLLYNIPGAHIQMAGVYSMDGNLFEFKGHVRTDAKASQMVTGWKSALIKPFNGLLSKNGAGVELPIAVSGAKGDIKFGLAMHDANESTQSMAADIKGRRNAARHP